MQISHVITISTDIAAARDRILSFFNRTGYKMAADGETIIFRRGSALGTVFSFNPSGWDCTAAVKMEKTDPPRVSVTYTVRTDPFEKSIARELWNEEADCLEACLVKGTAVIPDVKKNTHRISRYVLKTVGLPGGIFLALVIAAALAILLLTK